MTCPSVVNASFLLAPSRAPHRCSWHFTAKKTTGDSIVFCSVTSFINVMSQRRQASTHLGGYSDPFADPFFGGGHDPFAAMMQQQEQMMANMNRVMGGMMGGMLGGFGGMDMMGMGHPMLTNDTTHRSRQPPPSRRPSSGPIVEEPDSEPADSASYSRSGINALAPSMSSFSSTSMSSSSFSSSGGGGPVYFQSSTSTVKGPNGAFPPPPQPQHTLAIT
jgi:hypothetical protein